MKQNGKTRAINTHCAYYQRYESSLGSQPTIAYLQIAQANPQTKICKKAISPTHKRSIYLYND